MKTIFLTLPRPSSTNLFHFQTDASEMFGAIYKGPFEKTDTIQIKNIGWKPFLLFVRQYFQKKSSKMNYLHKFFTSQNNVIPIAKSLN